MNTIDNPTQNILSSDVELEGKLRFAGELTFDGKMEGEIDTEGILHLGDKAVVIGDVSVGSAVVRGKVNGTITAADKLEVKAGSELFGDIRASKLIIQEGVTFVGRSEVNPHKVSPAAPFAGPGSDGRIDPESLIEPSEATTSTTGHKPVRLGGR